MSTPNTITDEFWAYRACPRGVITIESHRRLGLVHRLRDGDRRHACEDVAHPLESTTHRRSVALEDSTADQSPSPRNPDRPQDAGDDHDPQWADPVMALYLASWREDSPIGRVLAIHYPALNSAGKGPDTCAVCYSWGRSLGIVQEPWPCPTVRAILPEATP